MKRSKESMYTNMVPISSILPIKKCGSISISLPSLTTISILRLLYTRMNYTISPFNMNTFSKMWGIRTPKEAKEMIAKQVAECQITEPKNLEEQALSLGGRVCL